MAPDSLISRFVGGKQTKDCEWKAQAKQRSPPLPGYASHGDSCIDATWWQMLVFFRDIRDSTFANGQDSFSTSSLTAVKRPMSTMQLCCMRDTTCEAADVAASVARWAHTDQTPEGAL